MKKKLKNITKMNYEKNRGYWVRFIRAVNGENKLVKQKTFSITKYGTWRKALEVAIKYRDKTEKELKTYMHGRSLRNKPHKQNKRNTLGVCRIEVKRKSKIFDKYNITYFWVAYGNIVEKSQLKIRFCEGIYGKRKAKRLAEEARKWIEKMIKIENKKSL